MKLKLFFSRVKSNSIFKNFLALTILQGTNFLIPLILLPYLNSKIGIDKFGLVSFIQVIMLFFGILTDYGFNLSATKEISIYNDNPDKISSIFSTVIFAKILLCFLSLIILLIIIILFPKFQKDSLSYLYGFTIVIGQALLPIWLFQGIQQMQFITYLNLAAKIVFTSLIFIFVQSEDNYPLVLIFIGSGNIISGFLGIYIAIRKFNIKFNFSKLIFYKILFELKDGWSLFIGNLSIAVTNNSNIIILSFFVDDLILGYYINAEKIVFAAWQVLGVFSQAIYPHVCSLADKSFKKVVRFYRFIFLPFIALVFCGCLIIFFFAKDIISIFVKTKDNPSVYLLQILSFIPLIVGLNIPAFQILLIYNLKKLTMIVFLGGTLVSIISNLILSYYLKTTGTCISLLLTQFYITFTLYIFLFSNLKNIDRHEMGYLSLRREF